MATGTAGTSAQLYHTQQRAYLLKRISANNATTQQSMGHIPGGSLLVAATFNVQTAFTAGTTGKIGTSANTDAFASSVDLANTGSRTSTTLAPSPACIVSVDTEVFCQRQANTAEIAAGNAFAWVEYMPLFGATP